MTTEIVPFTFNGAEVRTVTIDGEPWFIAGDVTDLLGYINGRMALAAIPDRMKSSVTISDGTPGNPNRAVLNEAGVNRLIMRSTLPQAERIQDWIAEDVLPSIRKTGSYIAPTSDLDQIKALHAAVGTLLEHNERIVGELAAAKPSAEAWDELASAQGDYDVAEAAKILARAGIVTGPQRLFDQMYDLGWIFRAPGTRKWEPYASRVDIGYLAMKPQSHYHPKSGDVVLDPPQVRVTLKGIKRLRVIPTEPKAVAA